MKPSRYAAPLYDGIGNQELRRAAIAAREALVEFDRTHSKVVGGFIWTSLEHGCEVFRITYERDCAELDYQLSWTDEDRAAVKAATFDAK